MPLVSAVVPVYNVAGLLGSCLDSLLKQTHRNIEIICINDGSTDESALVLSDYQKKDKRISIFEQKNKGLSAARNAGLKKAAGEFVVFCDSDDYFHPQFIEKLLDTAQKTNSDVVCGKVVPTTQNYPIDFSDLSSLDSEITVIENPIDAFLNTGQIATGVCRNLYRKSALKDLTFLEGIYFEDVPFMTELMLQISKAALTEYPVHYYYQSPHSIMRSSFNLKKVESYCALIRHLADVVKNKHPDLEQVVRRKILNPRFKMMLNQAVRKQKDVAERKLLFDAIQRQAKELYQQNIISYEGLRLHHKVALFLLLNIKKSDYARMWLTMI